MATYEVTSDRLSRPRGETFTTDELGEARIDALVEGGHLKKAARQAIDKEGAQDG
jgi:hypothetical protein